MPTSHIQPTRLLGPDCLYKFTFLMTSNADADQLASSTDLDLHCFQRQGISGFSRTRVNNLLLLLLDDDYMESESVASSNYTYKTDEHPELELLRTVSKEYGRDSVNPFTGENFPGLDLGDEIENDAGDEDLSEKTSFSSLDPAYVVIPTSAKAYAGVSKYMDIIRLLPVHIAKMILGLLDKSSLQNALCVSSYWRHLVEEVHREFYVNQQLMEEVMLMQVMLTLAMLNKSRCHTHF